MEAILSNNYSGSATIEKLSKKIKLQSRSFNSVKNIFNLFKENSMNGISNDINNNSTEEKILSHNFSTLEKTVLPVNVTSLETIIEFLKYQSSKTPIQSVQKKAIKLNKLMKSGIEINYLKAIKSTQKESLETTKNEIKDEVANNYINMKISDTNILNKAHRFADFNFDNEIEESKMVSPIVIESKENSNEYRSEPIVTPEREIDIKTEINTQVEFNEEYSKTEKSNLNSDDSIIKELTAKIKKLKQDRIQAEEKVKKAKESFEAAKLKYNEIAQKYEARLKEENEALNREAEDSRKMAEVYNAEADFMLEELEK